MPGSYHLALIPLLPLLGAVVNGLLGRGRSRRFVSTVGVGSIALSCAWAFFTFFRWYEPNPTPYLERLPSWIVAGAFRVDFSLYLDQLSAVMMLMVTGVGLLIHIYSAGYMAHEGGYYRFFAYLNLFMFFMLTLILASNYLLMFVGWEGVGLCSYLLIGFFFISEIGGRRRQEGVHRQPHRRLRVYPGADYYVLAAGQPGFRLGFSASRPDACRIGE